MEVLQAIDVRVDGRQPLDEYVPTTTDDFEEVEHVAMTDAGVTVGAGFADRWSRKLDETATAITFTPLRRTRVPLRSAR